MAQIPAADVSFTFQGAPQLPVSSYRNVFGKDMQSLDGGENIDEDRRRVVKVYDVAYEDRLTAILNLLGYSFVKAGAGGVSFISRTKKHSLLGGGVNQNSADSNYTNSDGNPFLYATKIMQGAPQGWTSVINDPDTGLAGYYKYFRMSVQYENILYGTLTDDQVSQDANANPSEAKLQRYCVVEEESDNQYQTFARSAATAMVVPAGQGVTSTLFQGAGGRILAFRRLRVKWLWVPGAALSTTSVNSGISNPWLDTCLGTVNSATLFGWAQPGTMLLEGRKITPETSIFGDRVYTVDFNWHWNANKWNYVWWPAAARAGVNNGFVLLQAGAVGDASIADSDTTAANKGKRLYDATDHSQVFLAAT